MARASPAISLPPLDQGTLLIVPRSYGTCYLGQCGARFAVFLFGHFRHRPFHLRLAGDLRRRRRCEWCHGVRKPIANPFLSLARAAVAGVAGDKLANLLGVLSDAIVPCRKVIRTQ